MKVKWLLPLLVVIDAIETDAVETESESRKWS